MSRLLSGVKYAECGVTTRRCLIHASLRCQAANSGSSRLGGSSGRTSSPAASTMSLRMASCSAPISMMPPRALFMTMMPGFATAKTSLVQQVPRLVGERRVDADDVAIPHEFTQAVRAAKTAREFHAVGNVGVEERDIHVECRRPTRGRHADSAEADDPEGAVGQAPSVRIQGGAPVAPGIGAQALVVERDAFYEGHHERDRVIGNFPRARSRACCKPEYRARPTAADRHRRIRPRS